MWPACLLQGQQRVQGVFAGDLQACKLTADKQPHNGIGGLSRPDGLIESRKRSVGCQQHISSPPAPQLASLPQQLTKGDCHGCGQTGFLAVASSLAAYCYRKAQTLPQWMKQGKAPLFKAQG
jgi:hypothetical protein